MSDDEEVKKEIHKISFSSDNSMFSFGTEKGFIVCSTKPFNIITNKEMKGGFLFAEVIDNSNIIALVGDDKNDFFPNTKVIFYDEFQSKKISELKFGYPIRNLKAIANYIFVVLKDTIYFFKITNLSIISKFKTYEKNENGVFAVSKKDKEIIFCFPDVELGNIKVIKYNEKMEKEEKVLCAHVSRIACLNLNKEANLICSASDTGTLIRVFNIENGNLTHEFRRGTEKAQIFSLDFSSSNEFLSCTSDRGTVHIFNLKKSGDENLEKVQKGSLFNGLKRLLKAPSNVISAPRSFAMFRINDINTFSVFGPDEQLFVVSTDGNGKFFEIGFDKKNGGETVNADVYQILDESP